MDCVVFLTQQKTNEIKVHLKQTNTVKISFFSFLFYFYFLKIYDELSALK